MPLKVLKRIWLLAKVLNCWDLVDEINFILQNDTSALNQISHDISMCIKIIELISLKQDLICKEYIKNLYFEIMNFEKRLANHDFDIWKEFNTRKLFKNWLIYKDENVIYHGDILRSLNDIKNKVDKQVHISAAKFYEDVKKIDYECKLNNRNLISQIFIFWNNFNLNLVIILI